MLIRHDIVFVFRVNGLVDGRNVDLVIGELVLAEILEEVCVAGAVHVNEREG
jgi:hypothetical protein